MMMNRAAAIRVAAAQGGCLLMKSRGVCSQSALSRLQVVSAANKVFLGSKPTTTPFQDDSGRRWISSSKDAPVFDSVGVIGLGLMGHGICQTAAAGNPTGRVVAYEPQQQFLDRGRDRIEASIAKLVAKNKITKEVADQTLGSIEYTTDLSKLKDTDLIVEAVVEDMALKEKLYTELGGICQTKTIFASNTSSLSIAEMASFSGRPEKFVGVHFFNPVQIMKLVEVIRTDETDAAVFEKTKAWVSSIGKVAVSCRDTPGFIVNRLLVPFMMNAMLMVDRNDATVVDIDISMQLGASHPMGPLHLTDYIGLDTALSIIQGWTTKYPNEPTFVVPKCLQAKVAAGDLGRKTGKGFYHWDGDKRGDPVE